MPTIISSTKLRNEYNAISEECHATDRPVFVTRNGNGNLAVMSIDAHEHLVSDAASVLAFLLAEGRADAEAERTRLATGRQRQQPLTRNVHCRKPYRYTSRMRSMTWANEIPPRPRLLM